MRRNGKSGATRKRQPSTSWTVVAAVACSASSSSRVTSCTTSILARSLRCAEPDQGDAMARQSDLIVHLGEVPLFSHCSKRDLQTVARSAEVIEYPEGARIVSQGEAGKAFYVLLDGS